MSRKLTETLARMETCAHNIETLCHAGRCARCVDCGKVWGKRNCAHDRSMTEYWETKGVNPKDG